MPETPEKRSSKVEAESMRLLSGLCHELGNIFTATRLYAQFLTDDTDPESIAANAQEVDQLVGISSSLLQLVRPIVAPVERGRGSAHPAAVLEHLRASLEPPPSEVDVHVDIDSGSGLPEVDLHSDLLLTLVSTGVYAAYETLSGGGRIEVLAAATENGVAFHIDDDGDEEDALADFHEEALRGRPLRLAIIDHVVRAFGGRVETSREGSITRVAIHVCRI